MFNGLTVSHSKCLSAIKIFCICTESSANNFTVSSSNDDDDDNNNNKEPCQSLKTISSSSSNAMSHVFLNHKLI
jgi:hypothetical protein